uniref:Uncharacterized protein n=1 Tax=Avena sativa TaxID=4498 RepID=A0ACD5YPX5_AVESA
MKHPQRLRWARANFRGKPPSPRCGHTAVSIGHSKVVFFGGFVHDRFLNDIFVYDIDKRLWYTPECTGSGSDGQAGPCPRAFHVAVSIDNKMYIFGGRSEKASLGDLWVLDTGRAVWQWSALISFGDMPCPREFSSATVIGNSKILMYGGWDGSDCLSDLHVLDTQSLDWKKFTVAGLVPSPRCGHSATVIDNMLVIFGGRGANKSIFTDSWALNGIAEEEYNGGPTWTELNLSGHSMHARCGHSVTSGEHHLLLFGGHVTDGWRKECIILHMGTQWISLQTSNEPPPPRSYHSMTCIGHWFLLFGGSDGKRTFADLWCLVIEDDPIAKRCLIPNVESGSLITPANAQEFAVKETFVTQSGQIKLYSMIPFFFLNISILTLIQCPLDYLIPQYCLLI